MLVLTLSCDRAVLEANQIIKVCTEIQINLNNFERKEVLNFIILTNMKKIGYTAAGYFVLNKGSLFALLSTATTYLIILIQFNQSH